MHLVNIFGFDKMFELELKVCVNRFVAICGMFAESSNTCEHLQCEKCL